MELKDCANKGQQYGLGLGNPEFAGDAGKPAGRSFGAVGPFLFNLNQEAAPLYNSRVSNSVGGPEVGDGPRSARRCSCLNSLRGGHCFPAGSAPNLKGTPLVCPLPAIGSRISLTSFAIHAM
jgi:hypothetical protein